MKQSLFLLLSLFLYTALHAQYKVTFILKEQTHLLNDTIYISGSFNKLISTPDNKYLMRPHGKGEKVITLNLKAGKMEYKFHRGNWDKEAAYNFGPSVNNRQVTINKDTTLIDSVKTWRDQVDTSAQILNVYPYMMPELYSIQLGEMYPWYFKKGYDTTWTAKDLDMSTWQKMKPSELRATMADKNGRIEGCFRARIRFDTTFKTMPLHFQYSSWAAGELYIDGILIKKYGEMGLEGQPFKEYRNIHKMPFLLDVSLGEVHTIALHFVDQVSPLPPFGLKQGIGFSVVGPNRLSLYTEHVTQEPIYHTLWVVVSTLFSILFWLLAFQNREEKNLFWIAITSTITAINTITESLPHTPSVSFVTEALAKSVVPTLMHSILFTSLTLLMVKIFNRKITTALKTILALVLSAAIIITYIDFFYIDFFPKNQVVAIILGVFGGLVPMITGVIPI